MGNDYDYTTFWSKSEGDGSKSGKKEKIKELYRSLNKNEKKELEKLINKLISVRKQKGNIIDILTDIELRIEDVSRELWECMEQYNQYFDCEPKKNAAYKKIFLSEMGLVSYMERYVKNVEEELDRVEEEDDEEESGENGSQRKKMKKTDWMQKIVWGGYIYYIQLKLGELEKAEKIEEYQKFKTTEQYLRFIDVSEDTVESNPTWFEETKNKNRLMLICEREEKEKREAYERTAEKLEGCREIFEQLESPDGGWIDGCATNQERACVYRKKALEMRHHFEGMLADLKREMENIRDKAR